MCVACLQVREQKMRPPLPDDESLAGFGELLAACWHDQPDRRWPFEKVLGKMQALVALSETEG